MADGTEVSGLCRRPDGRWRVSATGVTFVEPDERLAVARFVQITSGLEKRLVPLPVDTAGIGLTEAFEKATGTGIRMHFRPGKAPAIHRLVDENEFWAAVRELILEKPLYVAQMTGIEQIGYLCDLTRPLPAPTLQEIGDLYAKKPNLSVNEACRSRLYWKEFVSAIPGRLVSDVDHASVAQYETEIARKRYAPKSILHRYRKIRTTLAYAIKRGLGIQACRQALDVLAMLEVKNAHALNPQPITPKLFWAICQEAAKSNDMVFVALMMTALNACMYSGEVAALRWEEIDLPECKLTTRRPKTGVGRLAKLWPETANLLEKIQRNGDYLFNTRCRSYTTFSVLEKFRRYRGAAGIDGEVTFSMIRDASYSIAFSATCREVASALAGHRLPGVTDFYLHRNVKLVGNACEAIRKEFVLSEVQERKPVACLWS